MFDLRYWRCVLKKSFSCPDNDVRFYLYTPESGRKRMRIDIRNHLSLPLSGFDPLRKNVILIHGFNGTESKSPMTVLRDAYLYRGDTNIFTVDWAEISRFPCYLSSLSNTRLVAQCTAKLYAFMMDHGGIAEETSCVGHSLGAHICGMVSNHLDVKQHTIVGLDPARPLVDRFGDSYFRLTRDDAHHVQVIHTNAGLLGEKNQIGHVDFCVNGGMVQPGCKGNVVHIARCSHFQSACYFAKTVKQPKSIMGMPCSGMCPKKWTNWGFAPGKPVPMGHDTPYGLQGTYCVETDTKKDCPFN
ncbi:pancreatic lipase-related protein 2 [Cylas formicarius]|uniref:pancreatic lipase-related protein 2 n=1 Tax=Cylas formicarius TaxID=197179 RepID=UPI0029584E44|nr:pancreatic lipase-related protein 2 [Cylas formicarius]